MGKIYYRAIHTKSKWRKVNHHQTLDNALSGKDGAVSLFARKVRINYEIHGDPRYVIVWEEGAQSGFLVKADPSSANGVCQVAIPLSDILVFEHRKDAVESDLEKYFSALRAG